MIKLIANVCMYNESDKGNIERCLENLQLYCDDIVIYDDCSTDNSVEVATEYTSNIIIGKQNDQSEELYHKQLLLEKSISLGATHVFWLDCDEVLDRQGVKGGIRNLCERWQPDIDAYSFKETNLWRSQTWARTDSLFATGRFVRLWKVNHDIKFNVITGVHKRLYPITIKNIVESDFEIIHYGFCDYKKMMVKIGADKFSQEELHNNARTNWILDESNCSCYRLPDNKYPPGCLPPDIWKRPEQLQISELVTYDKVHEEAEFPLFDKRAYDEWGNLHSTIEYHGTSDEIHKRNTSVKTANRKQEINRDCLFKFNPKDKIIYDLGCGGGWFALDCIQNGAEKVYAFDIDEKILLHADNSFKSLGIPKTSYEFINMQSNISYPQADIMYMLAVSQHIPYWQFKVYLKWIHRNLKDNGEAHLQFHQIGDSTTFWNSADNVSTKMVEREIKSAGFLFDKPYLAEAEFPVWYMYRCIKR